MKKIKILLFTALTVLTWTSANAQAKVAIGIKAGLNFANLNTSSVAAAFDSRTGYNVGAFCLIKLAKIGIQPEIVYSTQGSSIATTIPPQSFNSTFNYVNIPIIVKIYLFGGLNLQVGPQFGFLTSAQGPEFNPSTGQISLADVENELKSSDISAALGLGWELPLGLTIDARYNMGLTNINDTYNSQEIKNQVFQLSAGFKLFKFGK